MLLAKGLKDDPSEEVLISGGGDGAIKIWSLAEKGGGINELHRLDDGRDEGESVLSLALDGLFLYSGRLSGEVNVWDLETKQLVRSLKAQTDDVLALSVGGGYLFCAGVTGVVEVCCALMRKALRTNELQKYNNQYERVSRFQAHNGRILASTFSKPGPQNFYITGGNDDTITIWDIKGCIPGSAPPTRTSNGNFHPLF
jgi:di- and tripeptidase